MIKLESTEHIVDVVRALYADDHLSFKTITAADERKTSGCFKIFYLFGIKGTDDFTIPYIELRDTETFPSVAPFIKEASDCERKIHTLMGLIPDGHPDGRRLLLHETFSDNTYPLRKDFTKQPDDKRIESKPYHFTEVGGEGIYEIPVGPIHAGIIEPGYFRISVAGEEIVLLEPRLGFVHKGSEKLFEKILLSDAVRLSEKISGDSSFNHSLAFCTAIEKLGDITVPLRANYLRVVFAELERITNHLGDIGGILLDTGFNFGGAAGARLRETMMRLNEELTGNRFLRGVNTIGGVTKDIGTDAETKLVEHLATLQKDLNEVIAIAEHSATVLNRLKTTGTIPPNAAQIHGARGVAARCTGIMRDARKDHPYAAYARLDHVIALEQIGDVYARFHVRTKEIASSCNLIRDALQKMPGGLIQQETTTMHLRKNAYAVGVSEGHRGENMYFIATDAEGKISRVDITDPSFFNWTIVGMTAVGNIVPDFPLINKSFGLSYSGYDV